MVNFCGVFVVGWWNWLFVGGIFGCGGGISSLWVAFLDTTAEFSGEIWQRNLAMVKNSPVLAADNRAATAWNLAVIGRWLKNGL